MLEKLFFIFNRKLRLMDCSFAIYQEDISERMSLYIYIYIYIYMKRKRERDRERERDIYIL